MLFRSRKVQLYYTQSDLTFTLTNSRSPSESLADSNVLHMSQSPSTSTSSPHFRTIFLAAINAYEKKTKTDLLKHPLATQLQSCNSSSDILSVLLEKVNELDESKSRNERLSSWLNPTINVIYAFSATLGQGVGLVSLNWSTDHRLIFFTDILARKYNLCWDRSSLIGENFFLVPLWRHYQWRCLSGRQGCLRE